MALVPKFQAIIKVWETTSAWITVEFARPADTDVLAEFQALTNYNGFNVTIRPDSSTSISIPKTFDLYDVAREVEDILRRHQFEKLKFIINDSESFNKEFLTMAEAK